MIPFKTLKLIITDIFLMTCVWMIVLYISLLLTIDDACRDLWQHTRARCLIIYKIFKISPNPINNDNGVPVTNGANGVDSNPDQAVIHTTRIPLVQVPIINGTQNRKSHSQAQFLPSHTTSHSKQSFISEPHQSQRRHLCSTVQIEILWNMWI